MIRVIWRVKIDQKIFFSRVSVISRSRYIERRFAILKGKFAGAKNFSRYIKNRVIKRGVISRIALYFVLLNYLLFQFLLFFDFKSF
jgi:hypothetical protein